MSTETESNVVKPESKACIFGCSEQLQREFQHLRSEWWWLLLFGILLVLCGTVAVVFPVLTSLSVMIVLGVTLMVAGIATIITSFWAGKWSGVLVHLLIGILYVMAGLLLTEKPIGAAMAMTMFMAAFFMVAGMFRMVAALTVRFPYWGLALLNGAITFLLGVIIYRHFSLSGIWVIGLLVGLEMLLNGWTWIMLALAVRRIPAKAV